MEGSDGGLFEVLSRRLPGGVRKTEVRIVCTLVEIRTENLPNTSHKHQHIRSGTVGPINSRRLSPGHVEDREEIQKCSCNTSTSTPMERRRHG
jgi:hypothetical protein